MAHGDKTQYDSLKKTEAVEFFQLLKNFEKSLKPKK